MDNFSKPRTIQTENIRLYLTHLREQERAGQTIQKYARDLEALAAFLPDGQLSKDALLSWKEVWRSCVVAVCKRKRQQSGSI